MSNSGKNNRGNIENLTPWKKGQSGNPNGRPKNTLKAFLAREFRDMNDDEKREWLKEHKVSGIDQWKMAEGNPDNSQTIEATVEHRIDEETRKSIEKALKDV